MAALASRSYNAQTDHQRVEDLLLTYRAATRVDVYPTIWRFHLLLTSRVWQPALDTQLWQHASGHLVAFAMLWRRRPDDRYLVLEQFLDPRHATITLADAILEWATQRAKILAVQRATSITLVVNWLDAAFQLDSPLRSAGFIPTKPNPDAYDVYFARSLQCALARPTLPDGFSIRPCETLLNSRHIKPCTALQRSLANTSRHCSRTMTIAISWC
jgi:hypothetical protein